REGEPDETADDGAVQPDELEVLPDAILDLRDERARFERLEALAHREPDLVVVAVEEVRRRRAHPPVERRAPLGVAEQVEDRRAEPAVDEVGEAARRLGEGVLELVAEPRERRAHDGTGLEALEERGAEPACLRERRL